MAAGGNGRKAKPNPRRRNSHRRNLAVARVRARHDPCAICGQPIDYDLPAGHPMCFEADDILPVSLGGDPYDADNLRASHRICNQKRGNRIAAAGPSTRKNPGDPMKNPGRVVNDRTLPQSRDW